eukprot:1072705-Rhodomonas_salina.1
MSYELIAQTLDQENQTETRQQRLFMFTRELKPVHAKQTSPPLAAPPSTHPRIHAHPQGAQCSPSTPTSCPPLDYF